LLPWIRNLASTLGLRNPEHIHVSEMLLSLFKRDGLGFIRSRDSFWFSYDYVGLNGPDFLFGWIYHGAKEVYDSCQPPLQNELIVRGENGQYTGDVNAVLFPETFTLLGNFNPIDWAAKIESVLAFSPVRFRVTNLLWTQVVLLDVVIHFLIRGGWHEGPSKEYDIWTKEVTAVINAIVESWNGNYPTKDTDRAAQEAVPNTDNQTNVTEGPSTSHGGAETNATEDPSTSHGGKGLRSPPQGEARSRTEWDLVGCLEKQADLTFGGDQEIRKKRIRQLADLLQLRAIFFLAFMLLNPDSSDVYLTELSEVEMPMV
jgi:hypothetical protein